MKEAGTLFHGGAVAPAMDVLDLPHSDGGPRAALPVILLHGFPLDHGMWAAQKEALAAAGMRVLVPDLRGHGKAPVGRGGAPGVGPMAEDVLRMADRAGLRRFALAGFSLGGYVAFEVFRKAPQRVAGLALVDTRAEPDSPEAKAGRTATAERVRREGMRPVADAMMPKMLTASAPGEMLAWVEGTMMATPPEGAAQALLAMRDRPDSRPLLPEVRVPTVVVVGEEDPITPPEAARVLAEGIPGARLVVVPGAAHLSPVERPDEVSQALVAWARGLRA